MAAFDSLNDVDKFREILRLVSTNGGVIVTLGKFICDGLKSHDQICIDWLNSFIFVIADNVQYRYKTQQYHTEHEDKMALVTKNFRKPIIYMCL